MSDNLNGSGKEDQASESPAPITNSLGDLVSSLYGHAAYAGGVQLSQADTLFINNRWYLISNYRQLLSQLYVEHGIVQTLIDQPVDDAFRAGFEIKTGQLDADEIEGLKIFWERIGAGRALMQAIKWTRLFGGGAVLIITDQDPATPLNIKEIKEGRPIEFRAVDMWELYFNQQNVEGDLSVGGGIGMDTNAEFFDYYGKKIHKTRVLKIEGKAAPSFIRPRLRGWGMSELERLVRSINQYLKNQDVIFELLDEAKVDVYKIKGFNGALLNQEGTNKISQRIQGANMIKNYNNALTMDAEDDYAQKQVAFTGLAEILIQIRQGIAADLKMPVTKLFGVSAAGFNSGEDDIENYNSMIEGEVRSKVKFLVVEILQICCQRELGFIPDDLMIEFGPLRVLNAVEEEEVKNHQFNRVMSSFQSGLIPAEEAKESVNKDSLIGIEINETLEALPPLSENFLAPTGNNVANSKGPGPKKIPSAGRTIKYDSHGVRVSK
jgi:phage-related protein (TIGR01555 family)